ncbi:MAG TPA: RNase adaptor protein RapZ, partial [Lachnospiraceae bacterium]|nr:RNase adaptor protein RapZ [Lachnospiraceae bacterium]
EFLKKQADFIIDTSQLLIRELKIEINKIFVQEQEYGNFYITILSFGFKYGIPTDCDLVFDVRFLPNPYYDQELKPQTGNDKPVYEYVMSSQKATEFLDKLEDMLEFLIPNYIEEGKNQLVVGIGCTGGKHRSVSIANALSDRLSKLEYGFKVEHRDIKKDALQKKLV